MKYLTVIEDNFDVVFFPSAKAAITIRITDAENRCKGGLNKKGIRCFLTKDDIPALLAKLEAQDWKCAITGWDMTLQKNHRHVISLDRIDSSKDYTLDNIQWTCWGANNKKGRF